LCENQILDGNLMGEWDISALNLSKGKLYLTEEWLIDGRMVD